MTGESRFTFGLIDLFRFANENLRQNGFGLLGRPQSVQAIPKGWMSEPLRDCPRLSARVSMDGTGLEPFAMPWGFFVSALFDPYSKKIKNGRRRQR